MEENQFLRVGRIKWGGWAAPVRCRRSELSSSFSPAVFVLLSQDAQTMDLSLTGKVCGQGMWKPYLHTDLHYRTLSVHPTSCLLGLPLFGPHILFVSFVLPPNPAPLPAVTPHLSAVHSYLLVLSWPAWDPCSFAIYGLGLMDWAFCVSLGWRNGITPHWESRWSRLDFQFWLNQFLCDLRQAT